MVVASPDDLVAAVSRDRRMMGYRVRRQGDGWIELEVLAQRTRVPVLLVLAWPSVGPAAAAFRRLRPHPRGVRRADRRSAARPDARRRGSDGDPRADRHGAAAADVARA